MRIEIVEHAEASIAQRHIRLPRSSNLRDIGGYPGFGGACVRWGMIYRSGAMPKFGQEDCQWIKARKIATVIDLRSPAERELAPNRWTEFHAVHHVRASYDARLFFPVGAGAPSRGGALNDLHQSLYSLFGEVLAPSFRAMFAALSDTRVPLIVHCSAGQDRTGLAIALVLEALGVSRDNIFEDYLLSTDARTFENELDRGGLGAMADRNPVAAFYTDALRERGEAALRPKPLVDAHGVPLLAHGLAAIEDKWGSTGAYLEHLGVNKAERDRLRALYLDT